MHESYLPDHPVSDFMLPLCRRYFNACQGPAWEIVLGSAGHFQFLDEQSMLQRAVCAMGPVDGSAVRKVTKVNLIPRKCVLSTCT